MGRCKKQRTITQNLDCHYFKPSGIGRKKVDEVELLMDEIEALSLSDFQGLDMKISAQKMDVSAPTFCRILESARKKLSTAILNGYAIKICPCTNHQPTP